MLLLVTRASGSSGNGFGALLAFELDGSLRGTFIGGDRIADPRGLAVDPKENLLFLNSGDDRVLAISSHGRVVRETGRMEGLNPGEWQFRSGWTIFRWLARRTHHRRLVDQS